MRVWKWRCTTHDLSFLSLQAVDRPPMECSGLADIVYPDSGPCWFDGSPVLALYPFPGSRVPGSPQPLPPFGPGNIPSATPVVGGAAGEAGRVATPPLPATRPTT